MKLFYLAYGSNLNLEEMKKRCPKAVAIGSCFLDNYRLIFKGNDEGFSYLTVEESELERVPCGLFYLEESDIERLDCYEGYPDFYTKRFVKVNINNTEVYALIYIMNDYSDYSYNLPAKSYLERCLKGYQDFSINNSYLIKAYYDTKNEIRKTKIKQYK